MHYSHLKSFTDFILALIAIIIFTPLIIIISIFVTLETGKFPIFKQLRGITLSNKRLFIYKFQTLKSNGYKLQTPTNGKIEHKYLENQITYIGKFLRKTGLDEIPQLFNVLLGNMSLIGPRPLISEDLNYIKNNYPFIYELRDKLKTKPGITGLWQVNRNGDFNVRSLIYWDLYYEKNQSLFLDLKIFLKTLKIILLYKHNDAISNSKYEFNFSITFYLSYLTFLTLILIQLIK